MGNSFITMILQWHQLKKMFDDNQNILSYGANGLENPTSQIYLGLASKLKENESFLFQLSLKHAHWIYLCHHIACH